MPVWNTTPTLLHKLKWTTAIVIETISWMVNPQDCLFCVVCFGAGMYVYIYTTPHPPTPPRLFCGIIIQNYTSHMHHTHFTYIYMSASRICLCFPDQLFEYTHVYFPYIIHAHFTFMFLTSFMPISLSCQPSACILSLKNSCGPTNLLSKTLPSQDNKTDTKPR